MASEYLSNISDTSLVREEVNKLVIGATSLCRKTDCDLIDRCLGCLELLFQRIDFLMRTLSAGSPVFGIIHRSSSLTKVIRVVKFHPGIFAEVLPDGAISFPLAPLPEEYNRRLLIEPAPECGDELQA